MASENTCPREIADICKVARSVLTLQPDPVEANRPKLVDVVGVGESGGDVYWLVRGELLFDAVWSNLHVFVLHDTSHTIV